ncbi:hypothetical protein MMC09_002813 [Bachmanniomyces sp. S44760]|nr:hypothetical protein [Bachmanniomyces sp. S44760]
MPANNISRLAVCALLSLTAVANPVIARKQPTKGECSEDSVLQALQHSSKAAIPFCQTYAPQPTSIVSITVTDTTTLPALTVTQSMTWKPELTIKVQADYVEIPVTVTGSCASAATPTEEAESSPRRGGKARRHAAPEPEAEAEAQAAPLAIDLPTYIASFEPSQISSACSCLVTMPTETHVVTHAFISTPLPSTVYASAADLGGVYSTVGNTRLPGTVTVCATASSAGTDTPRGRSG